MYTVGGVRMELPLIVGAGVCKTPDSVLPYMRPDVSVGAVCTGSYTPDRRPGNEGVLFWPEDDEQFHWSGFGLNSLGMPNMGFDAAARKLAPKYVHPLIVSVAGSSVGDYAHGVRVFDPHPGVAAMELNFACPNAHDLKPVPIAYDIGSLSAILNAIGNLRLHKPIWVKLSPYVTDETLHALAAEYPHLDFTHVPVVHPDYLSEVLALLRGCSFVRAVVFSNTLPNVIYRLPNGRPATTPNGGKAGLSGAILRPISLELVRQAVLMLGGDIDVVGGGGILSGKHAMEYFAVRAKAVSCASGPFWSGDGPRFFANLIMYDEGLQHYLLSGGQPVTADPAIT